MVWIWSCVACPEYWGLEFVVQLDQISGIFNGEGGMGMDLMQNKVQREFGENVLPLDCFY